VNRYTRWTYKVKWCPTNVVDINYTLNESHNKVVPRVGIQIQTIIISIWKTPYLPRASEKGDCSDDAMSRAGVRGSEDRAVSLLILRGQLVDTVNIAVCPVTTKASSRYLSVDAGGRSDCR